VSADGEVEPVGRPGSLVGVLPDARFEDRTVRLAAGEVLLAYTDGVTEGRRGREFFGEERLSRVASYHRSAPSVADAVVAEVLEFQEDRPRDDIAVVAVRVPTARDTRAEPGREPIGEEPPS
jgi:sigma-B regulation protein RsbU (phosphoserine phosphatase)